MSIFAQKKLQVKGYGDDNSIYSATSPVDFKNVQNGGMFEVMKLRDEINQLLADVNADDTGSYQMGGADDYSNRSSNRQSQKYGNDNNDNYNTRSNKSSQSRSNNGSSNGRSSRSNDNNDEYDEFDPNVSYRQFARSDNTNNKKGNRNQGRNIRDNTNNYNNNNDNDTSVNDYDNDSNDNGYRKSTSRNTGDDWTAKYGQNRWYGGARRSARGDDEDDDDEDEDNDEDWDEDEDEQEDRRRRGSRKSRSSNRSGSMNRSGEFEYRDRDKELRGKRSVSRSRTGSKGRRSSRSRRRYSRENDPLAPYREYVKFIQQDFGLKGGPMTNSFAAFFRNEAKKNNPDASQEELNEAAKQIYFDAKRSGKLDDIYQRVQAESERKRSAKKAQKEAAKNAGLI